MGYRGNKCILLIDWFLMSYIQQFKNMLIFLLSFFYTWEEASVSSFGTHIVLFQAVKEKCNFSCYDLFKHNTYACICLIINWLINQNKSELVYIKISVSLKGRVTHWPVWWSQHSSAPPPPGPSLWPRQTRWRQASSYLPPSPAGCRIQLVCPPGCSADRCSGSGWTACVGKRINAWLMIQLVCWWSSWFITYKYL